jgi:prevent-host-death family protein
MDDPTVKPVTELKRHATRIIEQLDESRTPLLITERGRAAAVMLDVESYRSMLRKLELLEGIARGERAIADGRVVSHRDAKKRLERWSKA